MGKKKETKKSKKNKNNKKNKFFQKHPKIALALKILLLIIVLATVIGAGIVAGMLYGVWGEDFTISEDELIISAANTVIVDSNENVMEELRGDENRKIVTLSEMSEYLPKAYVAIEDERFYQHSGVDFKRTGAAIASYVIHGGKSSFGGSTITQQLVKNITQDDERSGKAGVIRKVKEWAKAYQIERMLSKDQILELYLNIIFVGSNNYGVEIGAEYYFGKSAKDLSLAECAFLAGINNAPNKYNPYDTSTDNTERIKTRTQTVLGKMLELGYINQSEYDEASKTVGDGLTFTQKQENQDNVYSYHTDALIAQVIAEIAEEKKISTQLATTYVYSSGLKIYSTEDKNVQGELEKVFEDNSSKYTIKSKETKAEDGQYVNSQAAMVVIDNKTGYVVGCVGELGKKTTSRGLNRATQAKRSTGSSIKPIADLVPAIEEGLITPATLYNDSETEFPGTPVYKPKDESSPKGVITVRSATTTSQNIPFVKIMAELTTKTSMEYLRKMGISSLDDQKDAGLSLAIGGLWNGISPLEMAAAYETIANDGEYTEPTFYTKIVDANGDIVMEKKQKKEQVCSTETAYVVKNILQSVVNDAGGTARYCAISGMDVAAKTGTTNDHKDRWLCGFTTYYSAATWYGFDKEEEVVFKGNNPAGQLWSAVMSELHKSKEKTKFERPSGVVTIKVCSATGQKATSRCSSTYDEICVAGKEPEECQGHKSAQVCSETGLLANPNCPAITKYYGTTVLKESLGLWKTLSGGTGSGGMPPTKTCTVHTEKADKTGPLLVLNGDSTIKLKVGESYVEKGATAKDDKDGDLTSKIEISGSVNTSKAGTYTITYKVKDSQGNETTKVRTIIVEEKTTTSGGNTTTNPGGNTVTPPSGGNTIEPPREVEPEPGEEGNTTTPPSAETTT